MNRLLSGNACYAMGMAWSVFILYCMGRFKVLSEQDVVMPRIPEWLTYWGPILAFGAGPGLAGAFSKLRSGMFYSVAGVMTGILGLPTLLLVVGWAKPKEISSSLLGFTTYMVLILICTLIAGAIAWHTIGRRIPPTQFEI